MSKRYCYIITALLFFMLANTLKAQLRFKHLGIAEGLSQSSVYCLFQDSKGFIWIGTFDGLSRYDGYSFRHFKYDQTRPYSMSSNEPIALGEDKEGNLLVGTSLGLDLFDRKLERFHKIVSTDKRTEFNFRFAKLIRRDSQGNLWVATNKGLYLYDEKARALKPVDLGRGPGKPFISAIAEDNSGVLWLGSAKDVICYHPRSGRILPLPNALLQNPRYLKSFVHSIAVDSAQNVWIGTEKDGLLIWDRKADAVSNFNSDTRPFQISSDMVRAITFHNGDAWIGTRNGLYTINGSRTSVKNYVVDKYDPYSISGNSILCFMKDNAGSLWVGTFAGGLSVEHPGNENFSYINEQMGRQPGLNNRVVSSIKEDKDHNLWIATEGGGINYYNTKNNTFQYIHMSPGAPHHINPEMVKAIHLDEKQQLWIGTLEGLYSYSQGKIRAYPLKETPQHLTDDVVYGVAGDENNRWIGTKGGLFRMDNTGALTRYRNNKKDPHSIISNDINALMQDSEGGVWIGTEAGLSCLPKGQKSFVNYLNEYDSVFNKNAILCIYEDDRRNIWIGTRGGGLKLLNRERNQFFTLDTAFGLSSNIVHGIIQDKKGDLWVSFNQSIARITLGKAHAPFTKDVVQVVNYAVNNGLGSNEFLAAACRTASGEVMFGGNNGIVQFHPDKLVINKVKPPVVFTSFSIKNKPVTIGGKNSPLEQSISYTDHITLTHDQAYFTLGFAALNYINSSTNQYAYMLEGLHGEMQWNYAGNQQTATYTNLDAGEYVFKVKAANNDGYWNEQYTSLHITVLPPLWKTWYAYLFYGLITGGILYIFWSHSIKTTRLKHEILLQQRSREKDRELAQRKLSFFTNISHEIKTPLTLILAPLEKLVDQEKGNNKVLNQLLLMQRNGERLMRLTDQLLDFRKFEAGHMQLQIAEQDIVQFIREVILSFDAYARQRNLKLTMHAAEPEMLVWFDHDKLEKILFNLISNAVKFTPPGGRIKISLKTLNRQMVITVEDNGAGIAPQHISKIFNPFHHYNDTGLPISGTGIGLAFTKGLVSLHRGTITVESRQSAATEPGETCFSVSFPMHAEQYVESEISTGTLERTEAPLPSAEEIPLEADGEGNGQVMLIVEDNAEMLSFVASHFRQYYTVHEAIDGKEGWKTATEVLPDIIISDVMMPGLSGTDLCRKLKKDERTSHIPVILLTARTPLVFQMEGFETGADDYVTKPFNLGLLQLRVNNLLASRALLRERYSKDIMLQPRNIAITSADEIFLEKVMVFIDANILEPTLNVEQLAKEVNMTRITLYRKIKALTNQTTIEFIRSVRLKRAAQLLARNEFTVTEVAYMVGFSDVDYFRKWFKTEFGSTPRDYATSQSSQP